VHLGFVRELPERFGGEECQERHGRKRLHRLVERRVLRLGRFHVGVGVGVGVGIESDLGFGASGGARAV